MVKIRMMDRTGDKVTNVPLNEALETIEENLDQGNLVYNEDEKKLVTKATMGQITEESNVGITPAIRGG